VVIFFFIVALLIHRLILQSPKGPQYLSDLIGLRSSFVLLQVDTRVPRPGRFEYMMTSHDSGLTEELPADDQQPRKPKVAFIGFKLANRLVNSHRPLWYCIWYRIGRRRLDSLRYSGFTSASVKMNMVDVRG
jgi:hypothetical protein